MRHPRVVAALLAMTAGAALSLLDGAHGQQLVRNGFEGREPGWVKGPTDASFRETIHEVTDQTAHTGQYSEHIQLTTETGSFIHYMYPVGKAPISEELGVSLWVKANRPGVQLLARLVLPHEPNPTNLDDRLTTLVRGDQYDRVGRWQRLELRQAVQLARQQQQLMRAELKRDINISDAYIDRLVLNVYGGPGLTEVWIDDLEAGPVTEEPTFRTTSQEGGKQPGRLIAPSHVPGRAATVEFRNSLLIGGKPFLMRGIRYSDTPLKTLRDAGFNTLWLDHTASPSLVEEAVNLGFWVAPVLPVATSDGHAVPPEEIAEEIRQFLPGDAVLFWNLGGGLAREQADLVAAAAQAIHLADPGRPLGVDAWDGLRAYSRSVDLLGVHRWPLMTSLEMSQYRQWLEQRRLLARPGAFLWTWVQTHLPDWYTNLLYDRPGSASFEEPIGPQPEQIRLLTYTALAAGCRGLGFWSDRFLADSHQGRDRLLSLAILNQELTLLEPLLVSADVPNWIDTSAPEVKAAVLRTERGILVLPLWMGAGAQFVPGQAAASQLTIVVPEVSEGMAAWLVSPAEVRSLRTERVVGGTKVIIPEFGLTASVVFTGDNNATGQIVRFQDQVRRTRQLAAQWARSQAEVELDKVVRIESQLEQAGHTLPDGAALLEDARRRLRSCVEDWNNGDFRECYLDAERTLRPLRILMRAQWEKATRGLDSPVASPYAVSFFTLPRHWQFMNELRQTTIGSNLLPEGDFEPNSQGKMAGSWLRQETTLDDVILGVQAVKEKPLIKHGTQALQLEIKPKDPLAPPSALDRTFLAMNSPAIQLPPGTLVRVSGWIYVLGSIGGSADGALFYDSAGGEPLGIRILDSQGTWKRFTLYRRVPATGTISVTLALTGLGKVLFDDFRIEPLLPNSTAMRAPAPGQPH